MKRIVYLIALFLVLGVVSSETGSIYDYMKNVKDNPSEYVIVVPSSLSGAEGSEIIKLSKEIGVARSGVSGDILLREENMILIGNSEVNPVTKNFIGEWTLRKGKGFIKVINGNLIIASSDDTTSLLGIIRDYEENNDILLEDEYLVGISRLNLPEPKAIEVETSKTAQEEAPKEEDKPSKKNSFFFVWVFLGVFVLGGAGVSVFLIGKLNRSIGGSGGQRLARQQMQIPPNLFPLRNYIMQNLNNGYKREQIEPSLLKQGWRKQDIDMVFSSIR